MYSLVLAAEHVLKVFLNTFNFFSLFCVYCPIISWLYTVVFSADRLCWLGEHSWLLPLADSKAGATRFRPSTFVVSSIREQLKKRRQWLSYILNILYIFLIYIHIYIYIEIWYVLMLSTCGGVALNTSTYAAARRLRSLQDAVKDVHQQWLAAVRSVLEYKI